ncbi:uncharacterized protein [Hetaerina americana]|uniref:uncharacterized protein n=1 Tax=Hetaerina americana TaxID=62018 RepID=UPI003A7F5499
MKGQILLQMACSDEKAASKDTLEDEYAKLAYSIIRMRKLLPKKCSQYLSKKMKMEHHILETTDIMLEDQENFEERDDSELEMVSDSSNEPLGKSTLLNEFADLGKEMDNILAVLGQIKRGKDVEIFKTCSQGMQASESFDEEKM